MAIEKRTLILLVFKFLIEESEDSPFTNSIFILILLNGQLSL